MSRARRIPAESVLTAAPQTRKLVYDAAGNIIHDVKRQFSYDARNRMANSRLVEVEAAYGYNRLSQRMMKTNGAMTEWRVYDSAGRLTNLQRTTERTQQEFVYLGLQPIAMIETDQACMSTNPAANNPTSCATPKVTYLWGDHLGTPRRATDAATNQIVWSWESAPFGETPAQSDPKNTGTKTNITLRFPGQQYDADTNLHYNQQRDYDPATGRYVQADPIGLAGGGNVYAYVAQQPTARSDVTGRMSCGADTVTVLAKPGPCDGQPSTCASAMHAAGFTPPYFGTNTRVGAACLATMGFVVKPAGAIATTRATSLVGEAASFAGYFGGATSQALNWRMVASTCSALTGPLASVIFAALAVDAAIEH